MNAAPARPSRAPAQARPKLPFCGRITAVQPRIRLTRSYDERSHTYQGYLLRIDGVVGDERRELLLAIGESPHARNQLRVGDLIEGGGERVENAGDSDLEIADLFRVVKLKVKERGAAAAGGPPWHHLAPGLSVYRLRGHRRLDAKTYEARCTTCVWGCRMPVEIILDHWNPTRRKHRVETFCYGPLACRLYAAGPRRRVQGRKPGMVWEEPDWIDQEATKHRRPEE